MLLLKKTTEVVAKIVEAHATKQPIEFIRHQYTLTEEEAYNIQDDVVEELKKQSNSDVAGYKISMTSVETQAIANTHEPAYGTFLQAYIINNQTEVQLDSLFSPLIEPEILFVLEEDLSNDADAEEIIAKSKICAGIEIPDARYMDWFPNFSLADLLADNTATGLVVTSDLINPLSLDDFAKIDMQLFLNDQKIAEGHSSAVLGNPVASVEWLVKKLAAKGKSLTKGMVISSGTFISPLKVQKGTYRVTYSNVGEVAVTFV